MKLQVPNKLFISTVSLIKIFKNLEVNVKFSFEYIHLDTRFFV